MLLITYIVTYKYVNIMKKRKNESEFERDRGRTDGETDRQTD